MAKKLLRAQRPLLCPRIEAHAARLEQLNDDRWPLDGEAQARMLRAAQALYDLDAVTVGGGGLLAATACWLARKPAIGGSGARAAVVGRQVLDVMPSPAEVAATATIALARDVIARLRPVLGERAGIAVVLPDASRLAAELGRPGDEAAAGDVLVELVRAIGADEPDLFLLAGDDALDPTLEALGDFFGVPIVPLGAGAPAGVVAHPVDDLLAGRASPGGWLRSTAGEVPAATDPAALRAALARLRDPA